MLLHVLRRSRTLARWVTVWFVLAMGVAVAAPTLQPLELGNLCSASVLADADGGADGTGLSHHTLQCVLCLGLSAPPVQSQSFTPLCKEAGSLVVSTAVEAVLAARPSPLTARAPPAI